MLFEVVPQRLAGTCLALTLTVLSTGCDALIEPTPVVAPALLVNRSDVPVTVVYLHPGGMEPIMELEPGERASRDFSSSNNCAPATLVALDAAGEEVDRKLPLCNGQLWHIER